MNRVRIARLLVAVVLALFAISPLASSARGVAAQTASTAVPSIVASGFGRASGPAATANIQVILASNVAMYGYAPNEVVIASDEPVVCETPPCGEMGTPVSDSGMMSGGMMGGSGDIEAGLPAVLAAITQNGVAEDQIERIVPAFNSMFTGPGGPGGAQLRFAIANPSLDGLTKLDKAVSDAASSAGLTVQHFGVQYVAADCDALTQQARVAAVADARKRAEGLAEALGVKLGDLIQAMGDIYYAGDGPDGCSQDSPAMMGPYGPGIFAPFDASEPAQATVYAQVTLTFAIAES